MPKKIVAIPFLVAFLFLTKIGFTQSLPSRSNLIDTSGNKYGDWIFYYDSDWNSIENETNAEFYRLITYKEGKPIGKVVDYFRNGKMQMSIDSLITEEPLQYEGMLALYSEEGNMISVEIMKKGQMDTTTTILKFKQLIDNYQKEIPGHLDLANTTNNLAYLYREQPQYDSAETYYRIAQEIREKELGTNHVIYGNSCNKLGYVLMKQGKLEQAEPMYMISKKIHDQTLGKESDYYKNARGNLAYIYLETGRYEQAELLYQEAIGNQMNTVDKKDESFRFYCYQLARINAKLSRWEKARDFYLDSKNITEVSKKDMLWFVELLK